MGTYGLKTFCDRKDCCIFLFVVAFLPLELRAYLLFFGACAMTMNMLLCLYVLDKANAFVSQIAEKKSLRQAL